MSFYFRDKSKFGDKLRGKSGDELLQEIKQQFDEDSKLFFTPTSRSTRDPFERHAGFSRGFPFDDDSFGRRSDIRAHLDGLAARHPEFADHLLGPPWGDIPFHGFSHKRGRRGSGSGGSSYQGYPDEDARSQASGSSAASGASGVSSHGEPESTQQTRHEPRQESKRNPIPQYGLRNTVDIGQHRHNMENPEKGNRGQRSMSAPPENRQQQSPQEQSQQQPQGQRFISRVDITPQHNQPQQQQKPQQPQQKPQQQQQSGNVRHIPIFVEGRDEPVISRNASDVPFQRQPSPPHFESSQFHGSPHFQRPSTHFNQSFGGRQWPPHFQDPFYQSQPMYEQPSTRRTHTQQNYQPRQQQQPHYEQQKQQQKPQQPPAQQQQQEQQEPPKPPKVALPKDPLERVALVQKEVDALAEQVKQYSGNSRKDKEYIYLDEMLTRELIKLDDIETEGRDNVRQARKNAIKTIQETISLLESKAQKEEMKEDQNEKSGESQLAEAIEVDQKEEQSTQANEPIPLPPGPSTLTKVPSKENKAVSEAEESQSAPTEKSAEQKEQMEEQTQEQKQQENEQQQEVSVNEVSNEPMDTSPPEKVESMPTEAQQAMEDVKIPEAPAPEKEKDLSKEKQAEDAEEKKADTSEAKKGKTGKVDKKKKAESVSKENQESAEQEQKQEEQPQQPKDQENMDVDKPVSQSPKSLKKVKKSKKQTPVSQEPIPLPAPESTETSAK